MMICSGWCRSGVGEGPLGDRRRRFALVAAAFSALLCSTGSLVAQESERLDLSGTGVRDTRRWELLLERGRRSGSWQPIEVPSQWQQQGFGTYVYGHDEGQSADSGRYRTRFRVPPDWAGRSIELVFEGVMTDAEVRIDGRLVGPRHQGGFTRFRFDVTESVRPGAEQRLEVSVAERSTNRSVNRAERRADYWVFGGIYRPVYLVSQPPQHVGEVAIRAASDGALELWVGLRGIPSRAASGEWRVEARVLGGDGHTIGPPMSGVASGPSLRLATTVPAIRPWSAELPTLYRLQVELWSAERLVHRSTERFGFRSIELRPGAGLFVNGRREMLKGINRHAFWPSSGRTLDAALDRQDVELMLALNLNAVRTSHYPPDVSFLEACDELGMYVIDELPGWHDAYDTTVGRRLVAEMVRRDRNHPSILFWSNGNEGGWNPLLDAWFGRLDPQKRPLLRPGAVFGGIDTRHYPTYRELSRRAAEATFLERLGRPFRAGKPLLMPTEALHGLYDGGGGASLGAFWELLRRSAHGIGLFLWSFADEAVERTDRGGALDAHGNFAPDGVVGPYRDPEGSVFALREVFSPVALVAARLERQPPSVRFVNRYATRDLAALTFEWQWLRFPGPLAEGDDVVLGSGRGSVSAAPGSEAELELSASPPGATALRVAARDSWRREISSWSWPLGKATRPAGAAAAPAVRFALKGGDQGIELRAAGAVARFDSASGELLTLERNGLAAPLGRGPRRLDGGRPAAIELLLREGESGAELELRYGGVEGAGATWRLLSSGWLQLRYRFPAGPLQRGLRFELPAAPIEGFRWLGLGPWKAWGNRLEGGQFGRWRGLGDLRHRSTWQDGGLLGSYAGVQWASWWIGKRCATIALLGPNAVGLSAPPALDDARDARADVPPPGGLTVAWEVPPIGSKFHSAAELLPPDWQRRSDPLEGEIWLYPGCSEKSE